MRMEASIDGKTWSPLENIYELKGFQQGVDEKTLNWWEKCLIGLLEVRSYPLERIADFILKTKEMIKANL